MSEAYAQTDGATSIQFHRMPTTFAGKSEVLRACYIDKMEKCTSFGRHREQVALKRLRSWDLGVFLGLVVVLKVALDLWG
jgi:hypothetical protein